MKKSAALIAIVGVSLLRGVSAAPPPDGKANPPDGCTVEKGNCRILVDTADYRVVDYVAKAGDTAPMHSHPAHAVVVIEGGKARYTMPDKKVVDIDAKRGDVIVGKPTAHASEHTTDVHVVVVELKDPKAELRCRE